MKVSVLFILILLASCQNKNKNPFERDRWQIVEVQDDKPTKGLLNFDYRYDPVVDTSKAYLQFLDDTSYVVANLYERGYDTNYYQIRGDTLYTNREPRDYLVIVPATNDTVRLYNKDQLIVLTLIRMSE